MKVRDQTTDSHGLPLAPGLRVRVLSEEDQLEGRIVRVVGDYDVVTVMIEEKIGRVERMYPCSEIEVVVPAQASRQIRRSVA